MKQINGRNLTKKEQWMLDYLKKHKGVYVSPTKVGMDYGAQVIGSFCHSSTASPVLLRLAQHGYVERNENGHYKAIAIINETD